MRRRILLPETGRRQKKRGDIRGFRRHVGRFQDIGARRPKRAKLLEDLLDRRCFLEVVVGRDDANAPFMCKRHQRTAVLCRCRILEIEVIELRGCKRQGAEPPVRCRIVREASSLSLCTDREKQLLPWKQCPKAGDHRLQLPGVLRSRIDLCAAAIFRGIPSVCSGLLYRRIERRREVETPLHDVRVSRCDGVGLLLNLCLILSGDRNTYLHFFHTLSALFCLVYACPALTPHCCAVPDS